MDFLKRSHYFRGWFWIFRGIKCSHFDQQETQKTHPNVTFDRSFDIFVNNYAN